MTMMAIPRRQSVRQTASPTPVPGKWLKRDWSHPSAAAATASRLFHLRQPHLSGMNLCLDVFTVLAAQKYYENEPHF